VDQEAGRRRNLRDARPRLIEFFRDSPLVGLELNFEHDKIVLRLGRACRRRSLLQLTVGNNMLKEQSKGA
jgi:hypothetical protein